jgi:LPXTG-motif cell wall-anchored protein
MSALVAGLALVTALSRHSAPSALVSSPIVCAPNADISSSGCGNTGIGQSGISNTGTANSGAGNVGVANSGTGNVGVANSGTGNVGTGNSGCGNNGVANSGGGNTGTALSGGFSCSHFTPPPPTTPPTTTVIHGGTTTLPPATSVSAEVTVATLPVTGRNSSSPLALALGLMVSGGAAVTLANRRRRAIAVATGGELMPLSAAVGLLLTGRGRVADPQDPPTS